MRALLAVALLLALPTASLAAPSLPIEAAKSQPGAHPAARATAAAASLPAFVQLVRAVGPAVVNISTWQASDSEALRPHGSTRGLATGFLIDRAGYVLTNHHVVEGADEIRVRLSDDREYAAALVGSDERTDVALIKIDGAGELPVAPLGDSEKIEIGEWVIAIGNPFGLDHTVTAGIVSGKGRRDLRPGGQAAGFYDFIQTDASINVGNSGGPLINTRGEVIGINTAMKAEAQGIAFAIPINMVKALVPSLREHGRAVRSWLGAQAQPVTAALMRALRLTDLRGALVADVAAESPAAHAGLVAGDLVLQLDGQPIRRADDLQWLVATAGIGHRVQLQVRRAGQALALSAVLVPDPDEPSPSPRRPASPAHRSPLGMTVSEITPSIARDLGQPERRGIVVASVEPGSPAFDAGLERGDVVLRIGDADTRKLEDYAQAVRAIPHGSMIPILVARRDAKALWLAFEKR